MKVRFNPLRDIILLIALSSFLMYLLSVWKNGSWQKANTASNAFNKAAIKGIITAKRFRSGTQWIQVDNSQQLYEFRPLISDDGSLFHANTDIGDSIIKPPFSTTVTVKSKAQMYTYRFEQ